MTLENKTVTSTNAEIENFKREIDVLRKREGWKISKYPSKSGGIIACISSVISCCSTVREGMARKD
jgi:hypothetical protein